MFRPDLGVPFRPVVAPQPQRKDMRLAFVHPGRFHFHAVGPKPLPLGEQL